MCQKKLAQGSGKKCEPGYLWLSLPRLLAFRLFLCNQHPVTETWLWRSLRTKYCRSILLLLPICCTANEVNAQSFLSRISLGGKMVSDPFINAIQSFSLRHSVEVYKIIRDNVKRNTYWIFKMHLSIHEYLPRSLFLEAKEISFRLMDNGSHYGP